MTINLKHIIACGAAIGALVVACVTFYCLGLGLVPVYIIGGPGLLAVFFLVSNVSSAPDRSGSHRALVSAYRSRIRDSLGGRVSRALWACDQPPFRHWVDGWWLCCNLLPARGRIVSYIGWSLSPHGCGWVFGPVISIHPLGRIGIVYLPSASPCVGTADSGFDLTSSCLGNLCRRYAESLLADHRELLFPRHVYGRLGRSSCALRALPHLESTILVKPAGVVG